MGRFRRHLTNPLTLGCLVAATAAASLMGPFGTFLTMSPVQRVIYWAAISLLSVIVAFVVRVVIADCLPPMSRTRQDVLMPFLFAATFTPILNLANASFFPGHNDEALWTVGLFFFNVIVAGVIVTIRRMMGFAFVEGMTLQHGPQPAGQERGEHRAVARPRLYARCGTESGRIVRLTVDDHYVIVVFDTGRQHKLLMRFADAVNEMEGQDGYCTHRSHWVSADAVTRAYRARDRDVVELLDGTTLPVSRTYRKRLESRGLLRPVGIGAQAVAE